MKTGNTAPYKNVAATVAKPQWSPVMKTGNTAPYKNVAATVAKPQWSPVMKTGNTRARPAHASRQARLNGARS